MTEPLDIVGLHEVATIAGVAINTASGYRARGRLPEPAAELACGPIWRREAIEQWARTRRRVRGPAPKLAA